MNTIQADAQKGIAGGRCDTPQSYQPQPRRERVLSGRNVRTDG